MDSNAVKAIILENLKSLRRFAYSLTNDLNDADDLVQVVVERLLNKPIPDSVKPLPWMFRVCKNAWIDELRSRNVRMGDDNVDVDELSSNNNHQSQIEREEQHKDLRQAIEALPEAYRVVISLIVISGLSYAETSQTLDIPIGTVMSRVARAREKLALMLNTEDKEPT